MPSKMRTGIFLIPLHPVNEDANTALHRDLELIEFADRIGIEEVWVGEHHSAGWEIIASPELFIAAAVERSKHLRFGTGVISLPYHNPLMTANRMIQLDHQSRGRVMFGVGPGLLASDATQLGIDPSTQRDRMVESLEVILRLLNGETVTHKADWFELNEAYCQVRPYTWPHPQISVASAVTPSGGMLAGRLGLGMLCMAASAPTGYDALDVNWALANDVARKHGRAMDRDQLRLVTAMHLAPTRERAMADVQFGFEPYRAYASTIAGAAGRKESSTPTLEEQIAMDSIVVGTPEDAIAHVRRLRDKQGDFGCILLQSHNWAETAETKKSYEMWRRYVMPVINDSNAIRKASMDWVLENGVRLSALTQAAVVKTIAKYDADVKAAMASTPDRENA